MGKKQLYWEDVKADDLIPELPKVATTQTLVKWAGASGDFSPLHYEDEFAAKVGVGKPIIHGALKRQWLIQMLTDWIGEDGQIKKFTCHYLALDHPRTMKTIDEANEGDSVVCKGKVTKKYEKDGQHLIDCEIWAENNHGVVTTPGKATVILPSRG
jgi:hypothetical protein